MSEESGQGRGRFLVLLALGDGPKHGYEVAGWVERRSGGFFSLSFGALYPVLHRLERDKLISGRWSEAAGKRKKVYALTATGRKELAGERQRHREMSEAMGRLLGDVG